IAAQRVADPRDADCWMNSVLAFGHIPVSPTDGTLRLKDSGFVETAPHPLRSIGEAYRRVGFGNRPIDLVERNPGAIGAWPATREFDPDVGQPQTLRNSALRRYFAIGDAAVMHTHAAINEDHVEIGLRVAQHQGGLAVGVFAAISATL